MLEKIKTFYQKNSQQIYSGIGILAILLLVLFAVLQGANFVSNLRGFQFDPFLIFAIVALAYYFSRAIDNQNRIMESQQIILEKILDSQKQSQNQTTTALVSKPARKRK